MEGIHCKLSFDNNGQFRRFLFSGKTFVELRDQVKNLLGLSNDQFQLCYLDNEGDMIIISSDEELACATTFSKDVLRIFVDPPRKGQSGSRSTMPGPHVPDTAPHTHAPLPAHPDVPREEDIMDDGAPRFGHGGGHHYRHGQWHAQHHMRGSGRGGCRRGRHGGPHHGGANWRDFKKDKVSVEIALLQSLLDQEGEMSEHTKSKLEKKLNKLQKKMEKMESWKEHHAHHYHHQEFAAPHPQQDKTTDSSSCENVTAAGTSTTTTPCSNDGVPLGQPYCKRERKNQTRELWIKIKAKKAELRAAEREGRDETIIKDLVSQLNALKLEKASYYQ